MPTAIRPGLRARLALLRVGGDDLGTVWGQDESGQLSVALDPTGWPVDARVEGLDGLLRTPEGLEGALRAAMQSAAWAGLVEQATSERLTPEELERGRELAEGRRELAVPLLYRPEPLSVGELLREAQFGARPRRPDDRFSRRNVGRSRDGEVELVLGWATGLLELRVDPTWLRGEVPSTVGYALREAFESAQAAADGAS